jgi:hypothetical protein
MGMQLISTLFKAIQGKKDNPVPRVSAPRDWFLHQLAPFGTI